jgi:hypothetical protein
LFRVKDDAETLKRVYECDVADPTSLVDGYPPALWKVLKQALARDPGARFATAHDFARALDDFARAEGRVADARAVSDVMKELFPEERERDVRWLDEASRPGPAPAETMHPPHAFTHPPPPEVHNADVSMTAPAVPKDLAAWPRGAPPDGMFSPAPSRPFPVPLAHEAPGAAPLPKESTKVATPVGAMKPVAAPAAKGAPAPAAAPKPEAKGAAAKSTPAKSGGGALPIVVAVVVALAAVGYFLIR